MGNRTVRIQRIRGNAITVNDWDNVWTPIILNARDSWNNSGAGVAITTTTAVEVHRLEVNSYTWTDLGRCTKLPNGNVVATSSIIEINSRTLPVTVNSRRSTVAHEMGHLFWLGDNSAANSLMNQGRNRENIFNPLAYDVNNVRYIYG